MNNFMVFIRLDILDFGLLVTPVVVHLPAAMTRNALFHLFRFGTD